MPGSKEYIRKFQELSGVEDSKLLFSIKCIKRIIPTPYAVLMWRETQRDLHRRDRNPHWAQQKPDPSLRAEKLVLAWLKLCLEFEIQKNQLK